MALFSRSKEKYSKLPPILPMIAFFALLVGLDLLMRLEYTGIEGLLTEEDMSKFILGRT